MEKGKKSAPESGKIDKQRLRRAMEGCATVGLLFVALGMIGPLVSFQYAFWPGVFKWIYAAGAVLYTVARIVASGDPKDTLRVKRLRRMEMWAGFAFCIGAFFWFYNESRFYGFFSLQVVSETITFTLAGALIQIVSSWMLSSALRKQQKNDASR